MIIIIIILILIFIFIFHITNNKLNNIINENFDNTISCDRLNSICITYSENDNKIRKDSCCPGLKCVSPNGNFHDKICVNNTEQVGILPIIKLPSDDYINTIGNGSQLPKMPDFNFPDFNIPKIDTQQIFTDKFWNNLFSCKR
jgi:hypothetical protein